MNDRTPTFQSAIDLVESLPVSEQIELIGIIQNRLGEDSNDASIDRMKLQEIDQQLKLIIIVQDRLRQRYIEEVLASSKLTEESKTDFTRPWAERRGIECIDRNAIATLVRVPLDRLTDLLAERAIETHRDVVGSEIELNDNFAFAFQVIGQAWSILLTRESANSEGMTESLIPSETELSLCLSQPVIYLTISDTCCSIGFFLDENCKNVESFAGDEGELEEESSEHDPSSITYILNPDPGDLDYKQTAYFKSQRRQVTAEEIGNIWDFAERLMCEAEAYDPGIDIGYLVDEYDWELGKKYKIQNPGFTLYSGAGHGDRVTAIPELVRVDYFNFGNVS
jgi:hypothetical protein